MTTATLSSVPADTGRTRLELAAVVVLAAAVSLCYLGHFVKPQSDFHEFSATGESLLRGELPRTFKRAPLYPLIIAGGGAVLERIVAVEAPIKVFAECFNAAMLPLIAALAFLIARRLAGGGAAWVGAWVALVPLGVHCTAHAIVEAPLVAAVLLTIHLAQRGSAWAYVAAAAAMALRYDVAGLLPALMLADVFRGRRAWRTLVYGVLAAMPIALWLLLTVVYWNPADGEHYIAQIRASPRMQLHWAAFVSFDAILEPVRILLPAVLGELIAPLEFAARYGLLASAAVGAVGLLRRSAPGGWVMLGVFAGYVAVHAVFPFREYRFAWPMAPIVQIAAGYGASIAFAALRRLPALRPAQTPLLCIGGILLVLLLIGEAGNLPWPGAGATTLTLLIVAGWVLVWAAAHVPRAALLRGGVLLLAALWLGRLHARGIAATMGTGREMENLVHAARWVRDNTTPAQRVVSTFPGLLQMYAGREPRGRFVGYQRIAAQTWPEILKECRASGITHLIWFDGVYQEAGSHYIAAWGLQRFERLNDPSSVPGVRIERVFVDRPNLWILRIKDAPGATRPATQATSGAAPGGT